MESDPALTVSLPQSAADRLLADRYRVIRQLGVGGMASVYLAEDERLGRPVAIKRLHADSPAEMAQRLQREAKVGASLSHRGIVSVYDTAIDAEGVLVVMEYVDGPTLSRALARGALPPEHVAGIVSEVAAALDHAHAAGVVHRDVKPANVLLGEEGTKLADLGIATATEQTQITRSGSVLGTPSYMAPEQLKGGEIGPAADVYALAAVAFEALAGSRAWNGRTPLEIAHRVTTEEAPDLRDAWSDAPPDAARLLRRSMATDPAERPASAGELASKLSTALAGGAVDRPGLLARFPRARSLAAAAGVALLLAGAVAWALPGGDEPPPAPPPSADEDRGDTRGNEKNRDNGGNNEDPVPAVQSSPSPAPATDASSSSGGGDQQSEPKPEPVEEEEPKQPADEGPSGDEDQDIDPVDEDPVPDPGDGEDPGDGTGEGPGGPGTGGTQGTGSSSGPGQ